VDLLKQNNVFIDIISETIGPVKGNDGNILEAGETFKTKLPVLYDAFYIVGGQSDNQTHFKRKVTEFYNHAYMHYKPIGIATTGLDCINNPQDNNAAGVVCAANNKSFGDDFIAAITQKRFWDRPIDC